MIRFEQVSKYFLGDQKAAVQDVCFDVDDGEFVFVTGHSGSGKTTILRLLLREFRPDSGTIFFDEQDLSRLSPRKVAKHRRRVGVVFQDYQLLDDLNVWENIALPLVIAQQDKKEITNRIDELLKLLDLQGYERAFPSQLSGGEAQRIGLARALATAPKVIFADEPTGNLDHQNAADILSLLQSVNQYGTTVIFATHNLSFLERYPDARQLELHQGKVRKDTKKKSVAKTPDKPSVEEKSAQKADTKDQTAKEES